MIRLQLNRAVLTPFLGQFWLANHSMLYMHISRPLPTISVIHIKMFHAWDAFSCFFGFRNTNDTEIKYNNSIHHWHSYCYTNHYCHHDHSQSSSSSSSLSPTITPTLLNLSSRSLKVMRNHERTRYARETREGREIRMSSVACRNPSSLRSRRLKGSTGSWENEARDGHTRG